MCGIVAGDAVAMEERCEDDVGGRRVGGIKVVRDFSLCDLGDVLGEGLRADRLWSIGKETDSYHQIRLLDRV
jgi:hypothetical protein